MAGQKGVLQKHRLHGLVALRRALKGSIRPGSKLGMVLAGMRNSLFDDLGLTQDTASESQTAMVELTIRTHLRWASTEAWLDKYMNDNPEALLDARVLAIVREGRAAGQALATHLLSLRDPRLTRQARPKSWDQQLAEAMAELDHDQGATQAVQDATQDSDESCLRLQRGCGVRGWGRDDLGTGSRGRGARARRALMSTTRCRYHGGTDD